MAVQAGLSHTCFEQDLEQLAPLGAELIGSSQAAVSADHTQVSDTQLHQVTRCFSAALLSAEILTAGTANHRATLEGLARWYKYC